MGTTAVLAGGVGYGWWSTGLRPFTTPVYVAVGLPVVMLCGILVVTRRVSDGTGGDDSERGDRARRSARRRKPQALRGRPVLPWAVLLALAAGLEGAGLALGGRSATVPTLSTVIDHALAWHVVRFVMFAAWLAVGLAPATGVWWRRGGGAAPT